MTNNYQQTLTASSELEVSTNDSWALSDKNI